MSTRARIVVTALAVLALSVYAALYAAVAHSRPIGVSYVDSLYDQQRAWSGVAFVDSLIADTCAVGWADSSRIVNGLGYDDVEFEVFAYGIGDTCTNIWTKYSVQFRNHLYDPTKRKASLRIADSLNTSVMLPEPLYDRSSRGSLSGDSLTFGATSVDYRNGIVRNGEVQIIQPYRAAGAVGLRWGTTGGLRFKVPRLDGRPLGYWSIRLRPNQQSCYVTGKAPRFYVRAFMYQRTGRSR